MQNFWLVEVGTFLCEVSGKITVNPNANLQNALYVLYIGRKLPCLCVAENETVAGNKEIIEYLNLKVRPFLRTQLESG